MQRVIFVAPYFMDATVRFVRAVAGLDNTRVALISVDPLTRLPPGIKARLAAHVQVADALDPAQIERAVRGAATRLDGQVDLLLGTLEQLQIPLAIVRDRLGIAGLGERSARNFRDKGQMKDVLLAAGLPCARHRAVTSEAAARAFVREVGLPVVVKPAAGAAAVATFRARDEASLAEALAATRPREGAPVVIEEFVVGDERSFETVSVDGEALWDSSTRYSPSPLTVIENPWIQWTVVLPREREEPALGSFRPTAQAALRALGMQTGISHMEWFQTPSGRSVISEVGARPPGAQIMTLNSYAHEVDFYALWARLVVHREFTAPTRKFAVGAAYFRGAGAGRVAAVHGLSAAQQAIGHLVVEARLPQRGQAKSSSYEGEGYAIVRHPETAVVEDALRRLISTVKVELR
ncbi:MAG: ATP-grasp domain-containing protein [Nannocystis sp.]|nr:ATP-grasp domain-containing protein [Nannocystis sp.]